MSTEPTRNGDSFTRRSVRVGSLFSGIGGLDLGLERAGMTVAWQSEIDPYCCRVLAKHWPHVPNLGDVTTIDWKDVERVDLICGGYPCQPFSYAGQRAGESDERHLWPLVLDAVRHLRPRWVLLENVPGHLSLGFGDVLGGLASSGYDAEWDCIPASALGAPIGRQGRDRVWIVAYPHSRGREGQGLPREDRGELVARLAWGGGLVAGVPGAASDHWPIEPGVGRVADGVPDRVDRLHALGNAVVPQVAERIGRWIMATIREDDRALVGVGAASSGSSAGDPL